MWFEFSKIKGAKIILHAKSPAFRAAKSKGFAVLIFICIFACLNVRCIRYENVLKQKELAIGGMFFFVTKNLLNLIFL